VQEYLVWRVMDEAFDWFVLRKGAVWKDSGHAWLRQTLVDIVNAGIVGPIS
jgi:hypothetical protein